MVPDELSAWTLDTIQRLLAASVFESRRFDFKEMLPVSADEGGKTRLRKSLAAFANSEGGFLIFGVKDDKGLAAPDRIVGVDPAIDLPEMLGAHASRCTPAVDWTLRNPPNQLPNGRLVHVIEIHEAKTKPHGLFDKEQWVFPKRTERGNEPMSYEEIRGAFRDQHLIHAALNVLRREANRIEEHARNLNIELTNGHRPNYVYLLFRPTMFEAAWAQALGNMELGDHLMRVVDAMLGEIRAADEETTRFLAGVSDGRRLVRLVQQVHTNAGLAAQWLARFA
jgi:hypothetical protein